MTAPRFAFWSTPGWAAYCQAYGSSGPIDNYRPDNLVVRLGPEPEMWSRIRPTHRARIRQGLTYARTWTTNRDDFNAYQDLHERASGRKTRPQETFDLMYEFIQQGHGKLLLVSLEDMLLGASFFYTYQKGSYYGSSARAPESGRLPIGHTMVWEGMKHLAAHGYEFLDLGHDDREDSDEKKKAIASFKHGFV